MHDLSAVMTGRGIRPTPRAVGIGYQSARLATIYPQPHAVPLAIIVIEIGIRALRQNASKVVADAAAGEDRRPRVGASDGRLYAEIDDGTTREIGARREVRARPRPATCPR